MMKAIGGLLLALALASASLWAQLPGRCEAPVSERTGVIGCFVVASQSLGTLPNEALFWHLYTFPSRADAAAAKAPRSNVIEEFDKIWLFAIAPREWRPSSGERVAVVGPLAHAADKSYTARYLEGVVPAGEKTPVHTHAGPEAWYLLSGTQCLETPEATTVAGAGDSAVVREGLPMVLSSVGADTRKTFALVLHDSAKPWTMVMQGADAWKPSGRCPK
jgi:quercetin dioxygenase-like cupin family protein